MIELLVPLNSPRRYIYELVIREILENGRFYPSEAKKVHPRTLRRVLNDLVNRQILQRTREVYVQNGQKKFGRYYYIFHPAFKGTLFKAYETVKKWERKYGG